MLAGILGAREAVDISMQWRQNRRELEGKKWKIDKYKLGWTLTSVKKRLCPLLSAAPSLNLTKSLTEEENNNNNKITAMGICGHTERYQLSTGSVALYGTTVRVLCCSLAVFPWRNQGPESLPPSLPKKRGGKRNSSDKKERREIQSHPSCYPGASGGGSVHPTYGERWPPWLTLVEKHGTPPSPALRSYCYRTSGSLLAIFLACLLVIYHRTICLSYRHRLWFLSGVHITDSTTHRPVRHDCHIHPCVCVRAIQCIRNGQTFFSLSLSFTLFVLM